MARLEMTGAEGNRVVRVQALFREMNEQAAKVVAANALGPLTEILCECGDDECTARIPLAEDEYERVRLFPTRFLVSPGHLFLDDERIVERTDRYTVVEKTGSSAMVAVRLDVRRSVDRPEPEPVPVPRFAF